MTKESKVQEKLQVVTAALEMTDAASEKYSESGIARATVHMIPYVGPAIDALIATNGEMIGKRRLMHLIGELRSEMEKVKQVHPEFDPSSPKFFDVLRASFESAVRTDSDKKRELFAKILASEAARPTSWKDPAIAIRLLSKLEEDHIAVLAVALSAKDHSPAIRLGWPNLGTGTDVAKALPNMEPHAIRMALSELVSFGLLNDVGGARLEVKAGEMFDPSELAHWFKRYLLT
jgi:hypothetical protein